jgi:REP element-mobilizing transposase RayT
MAEPRFFSPLRDVRVSRNRLPHWEQDGATFFLTFRVADSLPHVLIHRWREEQSRWRAAHPEPWSEAETTEFHRRFARARESALDEGHGSCPLRDQAVRDIVLRTLLALPGGAPIWSVVVMPNHLHALVSLNDSRDGVLARLVQQIKGGSARRINLLRGTSGPFWSKDYFDRLIRDHAHFENCARYIRSNPVKAQLRPGEFLLYENEALTP